MIFFFKQKEVVEIGEAFGGLGVYNRDSLVPFCQALRDPGQKKNRTSDSWPSFFFFFKQEISDTNASQIHDFGHESGPRVSPSSHIKPPPGSFSITSCGFGPQASCRTIRQALFEMPEISMFKMGTNFHPAF